MSKSVTVPSLWDDAKAAKLDEPGLLLYRSNLLGADLRITMQDTRCHRSARHGHHQGP